MRWREWLTDEFLGKYFQNRSYYEIEAQATDRQPRSADHGRYPLLYPDILWRFC